MRRIKHGTTHNHIHPGPDGWRTTLRRLLTGLLATVLLLAGPGGAQFALAQVEPQGTAEVVAELRREFTEIRNQLDRTAFDVEALSLDVAFADAEELVALVRDRIVFEQYAGVLRGAEGTLISGAGNSWDQALLLASLLSTVGYDVRIARGQLDQDQASQLLMQLGRQQEVQQDLSSLMEQVPVQFEEAELESAVDQIEAKTANLLQDTADAVGLISRQLADAGVQLPGTSTTELLEEASDYAWVEYRLGEADAWQSAHVAFDAPPVGMEAMVADDYLLAQIPDELQHRFRFQVFIEQRLGNELEVRPVTGVWERPVANLTGVPLTYVNVPDGADASLSVGEMIEDTTFFLPVFNGSLADGAELFDMQGSSAGADVAGSPAAGVFQTVGGLFGQAAGMLAGEDDPDEFVTLTAQWLEFTFIEPGGVETTHRRTVVDRIGAENRAAGVVELSGEVDTDETALALFRTHTFMVNSGGFNDAYLLDNRIEATLAMLDYAGAAVAAADSDAGAAPALDPDADSAFTRVEHLNLYAAIDALELDEGEVSYRHEPGLIVFERDVGQNFARVDVVSNARRTFVTAEGAMPVPAPELALHAGVWETRIEGLPITSRGYETVNTFTTFAAAGAEQLDLVTLKPADAGAVEQLQLPLDARNAIADDLAQGYVVIAPAAVPHGSDHPAWWRVHAETGETLGRGGDGRGVEMLEYEMQVGAALGRAGLIIGGSATVASCAATSSNPFQFSCCISEGLVITMGTVSLGMAITGAFAGVTVLAITFISIDVVGTIALTTGSMMGAIPSICSSLGGGNCWLPLL